MEHLSIGDQSNDVSTQPRPVNDVVQSAMVEAGGVNSESTHSKRIIDCRNVQRSAEGLTKRLHINYPTELMGYYIMGCRSVDLIPLKYEFAVPPIQYPGNINSLKR